MKGDFFDDLLNLALAEDLADMGDITSRAIFSDQAVRACLFSKDRGILCGAEFFHRVYAKVDKSVSVSFYYKDGDFVSPGDLVADVEGPTSSILEGERIALNLLSFLSGIASRTREFVDAASSGGDAVILDTRKTLPGYRALSKYAVKTGGGRNHRMGLYDMVMIKDNHIDASGGITGAVEKVRAKWGGRFRIEVECRNPAETSEAVACGVDVVMLDNMTPAQTKTCVALGDGKVQFEASGNMSPERVAAYSAAGVDFISVGGGLTQSVRCLDFSLKIGEDHDI